MASMYAVWHGPAGPGRDRAAGARPRRPRWPDALRRRRRRGRHGARSSTPSPSGCPGRADEVVAAAAARGINLWRVDADRVSVSLDETTDAEHLARGAGARSASPSRRRAPAAPDAAPTWPAAAGPRRPTTSPTRSSTRHHSETAMLRYLRRLADRDFALDRGMIPLGSCTMKLNATTEMEAITWPEFADLHPFAPAQPDRGHPRAHRRPVGVAVRDHRLRRRVAAAQRRVAGRAGRACWRSTPTTRRAARATAGSA